MVLETYKTLDYEAQLEAIYACLTGVGPVEMTPKSLRGLKLKVIDLSKGKRIKLFKWKNAVLLLWAYREGLYTNLIGELNVKDNIIRMNMWILCEYNRIMLL